MFTFLFVLAMEPFSQTLRQTADTWGIPQATFMHAVSMYADDMLIYIQDLKMDLAPIAEQFDLFGRLFGLKVNNTKSHALSFNDQLDSTNMQIGNQTIAIPKILSVIWAYKFIELHRI